jgi:long-chain acyl-CoA synthetase
MARLLPEILASETIWEGFEKVCQAYPDKVALIYLGEEYTYSKLKELAERFAAAIYELGIRPGDPIIIYIGNSPQWVISYLGAQRIKAIPVPVSPIYTPYEVTYMANNCGAKAIVASDLNFGYALEVASKSPAKKVIYSNMVDMLPMWKRAFGRLFDRAPKGSVSRGENIYWFNDVMKTRSRPPEVKIAGNDPCHILYTGGTTGLPKGIVHTHRFVMNGYKGILQMYAEIEEGKHLFAFYGPLFHMFWQDMFFSTIIFKANTCVLLPRGTSYDSMLHVVERYKCTLAAGVPTLYRRLLENDRFEMYDLTTLKYCWSAGDVLPIEVYNRWKERVGTPIMQVYGSTEMVVYTVSPLDDANPAPPRVGKAVPGREFLIVDPETLQPLPAGTPGEFLVSADYMPTEYIGRPEETEKSFVKLLDRVWFRTGDYVKVDESGFYYFVDRGVDVIKYKGYRVAASEIEAALQDHPAVLEACVVGVPDPAVGERIKAFVVLKEDVRGVSSTDLLKFLRERLAPYKIPHYIEFRDSLPKSKVGKLLRREMRDEERRKIGKTSTPSRAK